MKTNTVHTNIVRAALAVAFTLGTLLTQAPFVLAQQVLPVRSWGANEVGQLGNSTTYGENSPQIISTPSNLSAIAAGGSHSLALCTDGTVWAWGDNRAGALGYSEPYWSTYARQTQGISSVRSIAAGGDFSLAVRTDNTVWAWGGNAFGQLGNGTHDDGVHNVPHITPVQVQLNSFPYPAITNVAQVAGGGTHSLALTWDGYVLAWGLNFRGELGDGTTLNRDRATVVGISGVTQIAAGQYHSLALKSDGTVWAWGYNGTGQLGDGTTTDRVFPVQVNGLNNVVAIAGSTDSSLALKSDGTLWVWGFFYGTCRPTDGLVRLDGFSHIQKFAAGQGHVLGVDNLGDLYVYGDPTYGVLGDPTITTYQYPAKKLNSLSNITAIAAGPNFSLATTNAAVLAGNIRLQGIDPNAGQQYITLTFFSVGNLPFTRTVKVTSDPFFQVDDLPRRRYTVQIKGDKWLQRQLSGVDLTTANNSSMDVTLLAGDATNDNFVDINDLLLLINHYNKIAPNSGYLEAADFNCDGRNDISDLLLLIANYNKFGE